MLPKLFEVDDGDARLRQVQGLCDRGLNSLSSNRANPRVRKEARLNFPAEQVFFETTQSQPPLLFFPFFIPIHFNSPLYSILGRLELSSSILGF